MVEHAHEAVETPGIQHEQTLIEQYIDRLPPGALDHEFGARLAEDRRRIIDKLAGAGLDAQIELPLVSVEERSATATASAPRLPEEGEWMFDMAIICARVSTMSIQRSVGRGVEGAPLVLG